MEPNQNTAGAPGASAAGQNMAATPVQSATAAPVKGDASESLPKDNMMAAPTKEKKKSGSGMVIGLILCLLLAAGGIGFGVWMMMDGNTQKDALNQQISALKKQNNELQKKISNLDVSSDVDSADYIYVGEWGYKIKIPENLKYVSYRYTIGETKIGSGLFVESLAVVGVSGSDTMLEFANRWENTSGLGHVSRYPLGTDPCTVTTTCNFGLLVFSDDNYDYYYIGPQAYFSTDEAEKEIEIKSRDAIEKMLENKESYSTI
ncbi:hypothetical protein IKG49_01380 [Candidatus Saccharibacteria bacterium]|nr:hypothetical protein [Candidatus Saccharibacteria bacterium]